MQFLAALKLLITSLPALVKLVIEIAEWMKNTFGDTPEKFLLDSAEAFKLAREAKTAKERASAAAQISALIRRM